MCSWLIRVKKTLSLKNKLKELSNPEDEEDELESTDQDDKDDERTDVDTAPDDVQL